MHESCAGCVATFWPGRCEHPKCRSGATTSVPEAISFWMLNPKHHIKSKLLQKPGKQKNERCRDIAFLDFSQHDRAPHKVLAWISCFSVFFLLFGGVRKNMGWSTACVKEPKEAKEVAEEADRQMHENKA